MTIRRFALAIALLSCPLHAAEIRSESASISSPAVNVFFEGKVVVGDYERLRSLLKQQGPRVERLYLFSPGGNLSEALQIAALVKRLQMRTTGPQVGYDSALRPYPECRTIKPRDSRNCLCASSCFVIWAAGGERDRSALAVHRPIFEPEAFGALPLAEAEAQYEKLLRGMGEYIDTLRVPVDLKEKMLSTAARDTYVFESPEQMNGFSPAFDEWIAARCDTLPRQTESRYYSLVVKANRGLATLIEQDEITALEPKVKRAGLCQALEKIKHRVQLFSDYFGVDYESQLRQK